MAEPRSTKNEPHPHNPDLPGGWEGHSHSMEGMRVWLRELIAALESGDPTAFGLEQSEAADVRRLLHKIEKRIVQDE